jgi:opacity protein-like surface antigen
MKYFVLCFAVLVAFAPSTQAQSVGFGVQGDVINFNVGNISNGFSVTTGGDFTGDLKDIYGLGLGGGVHLDLKVAILSIRVSADYITLSPDRDKYTTLLKKYIGNAAAAVSIDGGRIDIYSASANLKLAVIPLPVVSIYATGGVGLVRVSVTETKVTFNGLPLTTFPAVAAQTKPAANVGAGVDLSLGGLTLFGELKVDFIFTDPKTSTAIPFGTVGITF